MPTNNNFQEPAPQPSRWRYSVQANGRSLATFLGDVDIDGSVIANPGGITWAPPPTGVVATDVANLTTWMNEVLASYTRTGALCYGVYKVNAKLPDINVPGVSIYGAGMSSSHDVGEAQGSVIQAVSGAGYGLLLASAVSGAGLQRLDALKIVGVTFDCNVIADYGFKGLSLLNFTLEISCLEAKTDGGLVLGVVATLGEARDCQRGMIRFTGRQILSAIYAIVLTGDAGANTSLNIFTMIDVVQYNEIGISCQGDDRNQFQDVRITFAAGGTATYSWEFRGGATIAQRGGFGDMIFYFTAGKPIVARGTGTYTVAASGIIVQFLDIGNGTPVPVEETGAKIYGDWWRLDNTLTVISQTGAGYVYAPSLRWRRGITQADYHFQIGVTTIGTSGGYIQATMPFTSAAGAGFQSPSIVLERVRNLAWGIANVVSNSANLQIVTVPAGYPWVNGDSLAFHGSIPTVFN